MKRFLSYLLATVMVLNIIPLHLIPASAEISSEIPDGYTPVYNIEDLYSVRYGLSGKYILMADIDMTEATAEGGDWDNGSGWAPIGASGSNAFSGVFDGNGHTITGMRIENPSGNCEGLFGVIDGGTVKNLRLSSFVIKDNAILYAGSLAGLADSATIENIAVDNCDINVKAVGSDVTGRFGGLVGYAYDSTISSSYVSGNIVVTCEADYYDNHYTGGIVGCANYYNDSNDSIINNCYNAASINGNDPEGYRESYIGGITGSGGKITNCINVGQLTANGTTRRGALNGYSGTLSRCYYLKGSSYSGKYGTDDSATTAVSLTEAQFKLQSVFGFLDFENTWFLDTGSGKNYPQLQSAPETVPESISISSMPLDLPVYHGDELDITGMKIGIKYPAVEALSVKDAKQSMISGYSPDILEKQTVTVSYLGKKTTFDITLLPRPVQSVELSCEEIEILLGETATLTATVLPENATDKTLIWESDNTAVATVADGLVTAVGAGEATVTAESSEGVTASCTVSVKLPATSIELNHTVKSVCIGSTFDLIYTVTPADTTDSIEWNSDNNKVCKVDRYGAVTAVAKGTAVIKVTASSGVYAVCRVSVSDHTYDNACDESCNLCGTVRSITHSYSNNCDADCNVCGYTRTVGPHVYSYVCDTTCNYCGYTREVTHTYSSECDEICDVCEEKRLTEHTYDNDCDTKCNICGITRSIKHTYKTVITKATLTKDGKIVEKCSVCGKVSRTTGVYYPKTIKLSKTSFTYNGSVQKPSVTVKDSKGNTLKKDKHYTVSYSENCKATGQYTVTVKFRGNRTGTKKLTYNIIPKAVTKLKATQTTNSIKLSWASTTGVTGYRVYKYDSDAGSYVKLKDVTGTSLTVNNLSAGTRYKYKVKGYKKSGSVTVWGNASAVLETATKPATPTLKVSSTVAGKATLTWSNVKGETAYEIYYSLKKNSGYKKVGEVKANTTKATLKKLTEGKTYYFRVRCYTKINGTYIYSGYETKSVLVFGDFYKDVLNEYEIAAGGDSSYNYKYIRYWYLFNYIPNIHYALHDLNGDGLKELIVSNYRNEKFEIINVFTYTNKPVPLFGKNASIGDRAHLKIYTNGVMNYYGSNGASSSSTTFYKFSAGASTLKFIESYDIEGENNTLYYYKRDQNGNKIAKVSEVYYNQRMATYSKLKQISPKWISLEDNYFY